MPFKSEKQRKFMYAQHPEIAERWTKEAKAKKKPAVKKSKVAKKVVKRAKGR
jgi:hypothetical protein